MENSHIEWCDHTFNPWEGCTKVSPGCLHCYAEARNIRFAGGANWGVGAPRRRTSVNNWSEPVRWNQMQKIEESDARIVGREPRSRPRVFCASLADWLDAEVPIEWLTDLLDLIRRTPYLDWLLLTKRPENWATRLWDAEVHAGSSERVELAQWIDDWRAGKAPANVWIGTTVEDQPRADERIPLLLRIPAKVRFLSMEPLLSQVILRPLSDGLRDSVSWLETGCTDARIDWVICGGESGPGARKCFVEWADDLRRQCQAAGVPFFMKQLGANVRTSNANAHDWPEHVTFAEVDDELAFAAARVGLNDKKGGDLAEFPEELRVREFPGNIADQRSGNQ